MTAKLALITGASGGIGEAFAHLLAGKGYDLALCARNEAELNRVAGVAIGRSGVAATVIPADLSAPGGTDVLAERLAAKGTPDVVVNNAGFGLVGPTAELDRGQQLAMIDLNVRALTDLTLRFLPGMLERRSGGIINVASVAAFLPGPNMSVYFATKAFVTSFTDAIAEEIKDSGVKIMSLCPGPVATGFQARAGIRERKSTRSGNIMSAEEVAAAGWAAFESGARMEIPGALNKLTAYGLRGMPRRLVLPIAARAVRALKP
jgi:uncharacterized protein